jgi:hypothetical protein
VPVDDVINDYDPERDIESVEYVISVLEDFLAHLKQKAKDR